MHRKMEFKPAYYSQLDEIWEIIESAIASRKADGSRQWQDGYPNKESIKNDIENDYAYILSDNDAIVAYAAVIFEIEPAYEKIEGEWLTQQPYVVIHRIAVDKNKAGKGFATQILEHIEKLAISKNYYSLRVDTNYDNPGMLRVLDKLGYVYCGQVYFRGDARRAYEKVLI